MSANTAASQFFTFSSCRQTGGEATHRLPRRFADPHVRHPLVRQPPPQLVRANVQWAASHRPRSAVAFFWTAPQAVVSVAAPRLLARRQHHRSRWLPARPHRTCSCNSGTSPYDPSSSRGCVVFCRTGNSYRSYGTSVRGGIRKSFRRFHTTSHEVDRQSQHALSTQRHMAESPVKPKDEAGSGEEDADDAQDIAYFGQPASRAHHGAVFHKALVRRTHAHGDPA